MHTNPSKAPAPFSCVYSPQIPELLMSLNCSIALSTYQAGKVVFLSAQNEDSLIQLPRTFEKPMGIAQQYEKDWLAVACKEEIIQFANSKDLARAYPKAPNKYDALYVPRITYHSSYLDIHDLKFGKDDVLYAVNTLFSCIIKLEAGFNFTPYWKPSFIDKITGEDRCHLNGMAMVDGLPKYVTAFNQGNSMRSWRERLTETGVLIDVESNEVICDDLAMPHSPRIFNNELYLLESATSKLIKVNPNTKEKEDVLQLNGFVRGMDMIQDYLFIGLSKLRKNSSSFGKLKFAESANKAGILIVHLPTKSMVGSIIYQSSLDEIYDVHIIPEKRRPNILNTIKDDYKKGLMIPDTTFWATLE